MGHQTHRIGRVVRPSRGLRGAPTAAILLTAWLGMTGLAVPAQSADAFYTNLLRQGSLAYDSGDLVGAAKHLRLACFGLLDEPTPLAGCLVRLATAQGELDQRDEFSTTFGRLLEVEDRFGGYSAAEQPAVVRQSFVELVKRWVPRDTLQGYEAFAPIARELLEAELLELDSSGRREAFKGQIGLEPADPRWRRALAELELEAGNPSAALAAFEGLAPAPQDAAGRCLRGRALTALARCGEALGELASCGEANTDLRLAEHRLGCLVAVGDYAGAEQFYAQLPADWQRRKALRRLAKNARRQVAAAQQAAEEIAPEVGESTTQAASTPPTTTVDSGAATAIEPTPDDTNSTASPQQPTPATTLTSQPDTAPTTAAAPPPTRTAPPTDPRVEATLVELRQLLERGSAINDPAQLGPLTDRAVELASRLPLSIEAHQIAGELTYRDSRFAAAARYFERARPTQPDLQFYFAVALFESGQPQRAATELRRALPRLQRSGYVDEMATRILGNNP